MKLKKEMMKILLCFSAVFGGEAMAGSCTGGTGGGVGACSLFNFTSATCSSYYMYTSDTAAIQCKFNGSYCSDSGGNCTPPTPPKCEGTYIPNDPGCSSIRTQNACGSLTQKNYYTEAGGMYMQCAWATGGQPPACINIGTTCTT